MTMANVVTRADDENVLELLQRALKNSKKATAAFAALPPSHQKEWLKYISEAKKLKTRQRRIESTVQKLAGGKR